MDTSRRTRGGVAALTAVVALTALGLSACGSGAANGQSSSAGSTTVSMSPVPSGPLPTLTTSTQPGTPSGLRADGYSTDGLKLTVDFTAGICNKYGLRADESQAGKVLVTIVVTQSASPGQICPALAKSQSVSTDLASPLDQRRVVDTSDGQTVPLANPASGRMTHGPAPSQ